MLGIAGQAAGAGEVSSHSPPSDVNASDVTPHTIGGGIGTFSESDSHRRILVVKDCNAWTAPANEAVLDEMGIDAEIVTSRIFDEEYTAEDLGRYSEVLLVSTQGGSYYDNLASSSEKLDQFVDSGG